MIHHSEKATQALERIRQAAGFPDFLMPQELDFLKASTGFQYIMTHAGTTRHECIEIGVSLAEMAARSQTIEKKGDEFSYTPGKLLIFSFDFVRQGVVVGKWYALCASEQILCSVLEHEYIHFRMSLQPRRKWIMPFDCSLNPNLVDTEIPINKVE
jgi:hypothetical protein